MREEIFQPGERFRGYVVEKPLGRGGLGAVYLVRHEMLDTLYALKVLYPDVAHETPEYVKRFLREARIATRIRHPNMVAVHDCGYDEGRNLYYLVMDYVSGSDLRKEIAFSGKLERTHAVRIVAQVASALSAAQAYHVVHRDIKPENIMIQPDGTVKLVDLGIAKASNLDESLRTTTDSIFGTPTYVSPEQARNAANVDQRADIYSLGIVFFEMVTGKVPFKGRNTAQVLAEILSDAPTPDPRDFDPSVPAELAILIRRMTMKDLPRRLESFDRVLAELARAGFDVASVGAARSELTPVAEKTARPLDLDMRNLPEGNDTLSLETDDPEVKALVSRLKRKRLARRLCWYAGVALAVLMAVLLLVSK